MIDAKLLNPKVESTESTLSMQSPDKSPQNLEGKTQFNEIFDEKIQELNDAKSGIQLPVNIDQQLLVKSESDGGIDFESTEMEKKEHTLGSRSKLIVLGDEPEPSASVAAETTCPPNWTPVAAARRSGPKITGRAARAAAAAAGWS